MNAAAAAQAEAIAKGKAAAEAAAAAAQAEAAAAAEPETTGWLGVDWDAVWESIQIDLGVGFGLYAGIGAGMEAHGGGKVDIIHIKLTEGKLYIGPSIKTSLGAGIVTGKNSGLGGDAWYWEQMQTVSGETLHYEGNNSINFGVEEYIFGGGEAAIGFDLVLYNELTNRG